MAKAKYVIADYRIEPISYQNLLKYAEKIIFTKKIDTYDAIAGHSDIQVCKIDDRTIVCAPSCYDYYKNALNGITVIKGQFEPSKQYPEDIGYNIHVGKSTAIHNFKYTDKITLAVIEQKFLKHINVHQGYSECGICELSDGSMITDDDGIYKTLLSENITTFKVERGLVKLDGMNYGFIGGATGVFGDKVFFNGKINDFRLSEFCNSHNTKIVELSDKPLTDIGSLIFLK